MNHNDRLDGLGDLGLACLHLLKSVNTKTIKNYGEASVGEQQSMLSILSYSNMKGAIALNLAHGLTILQMRVDDAHIKWIASTTLGLPGLRPIKSTRSFGHAAKNRMFKIKEHPSAQTKVNLWLDDVWKALEDGMLKKRIDNWCDRFLAADLSVDCVTGVILHAWACGMHSLDLVDIVMSSALNPAGCKVLNSVLKGLGCNYTICGALLCELNTLQGRNVDGADWQSDLAMRVNPAEVAKSVVSFEEPQLRAALRSIFSEELGDSLVEFDDLESYWSKRWAWCVNGAHSKLVEKDPQFKPSLDAGQRATLPKRYHKRVYAEIMKANILERWTGKTYYSTAEKLEHGKCRTLYSADTVNYFAFNHLLGGVERKWNNRHCVLDPGRGGCIKMSKRVRDLGARGVCNIMLDYDDFNSQHSTRSQQIVIEELMAWTNYNSPLRESLLASFDNSWIIHRGATMRLLGTLMSGHRGTMFINTVLNRAYLLCAVPDFANHNALHVGDDVYISSQNMSSVDTILRGAFESGLRMNPVKQSIGNVGSEFLRMAITSHSVFGYLARTVSSVVSGNWEGERRLRPVEFLNTIVSQSWTLRNRSFGLDWTNILYGCTKKRVPIGRGLLRDLLSHRVSLNGGPVLGRESFIRGVRITEMNLEGSSALSRRLSLAVKGMPQFASKDYLSNWLSPIERSAITMLQVNPTNLLAEASYRKSLTEAMDTVIDCPLTIENTSCRLLNEKWTQDEEEIVRSGGALSKYPLLVMLRERMSLQIINTLLARLNIHVCWNEVMEFAYGIPTNGCSVYGYVSYSDVSHVVVNNHGIKAVQLPIQYYF